MPADGSHPEEREGLTRLKIEGRFKAAVLDKVQGSVQSISRGVHLEWGRDSLRTAPGGKEEEKGMLDERSGRK